MKRNEPQIEIDLPLENGREDQTLKQMSSKDVNLLEQEAKAIAILTKSKQDITKTHHQIRVKDYAIRLIIACMSGLAVLYFTDLIIVNIGWKNSDLVGGVFELLKFLLSSLVGFVFAKTTINE